LPHNAVLLQNMGALTNMVRRIAIDAGEIIMVYFEGGADMNVEGKQDGSPVTEADRKAEKFIQEALEELIPGLPFIGEEVASLGALPDVKEADYFWLVDPLDGTKEFVSGTSEFTVNIALIYKQEPILGVVYAPALGTLYAGYKGGAAIRWNEDTNKEKQISVRPLPAQGLTVSASKAHGSGERLDQFLEQFKINKIIKKGSSLKICVIAEGKSDLYPRLGPTCEWDTGAGDAVLRAAGGRITDLDGNLLKYGGFRPKFLNPEFIASSFDWME